MSKLQAIAVVIAAIITAGVYFYTSISSDFAINIYPNAQYDINLTNGHFILYQTQGVSPSPYRWNIENMVTSTGTTEIGGSVKIVDTSFKHYSYPITLKAFNTPHGIIMDFDTTNGETPFVANINLKFSPNTTLAPGLYYITIRASGGDGKDRECTCTLKDIDNDPNLPRFIET